jgi:hypothetical protein
MAFRAYVAAAVACAISACWSPVAAAQTIDSCGEIVRYSSCLFFIPFDDPDYFGLPDSLSGMDTGLYHIRAYSYEDTLACGSWHSYNRLRNVTIESCLPDTFGCGRILRIGGDIDDCLLWRSLQDESSFPIVTELNGFQVNDVVLVTGILCPTIVCAPVPGACGTGFLLEMQLLACPDSLNSTSETSWGRIKSRFR